MKPVFVDTGAWIAVAETRDRLHGVATAHLQRLVRRGVPLLTSNYVVSETATKLRYDSGLPTALKFRDSLASAATAKRLQIAWVDSAVEAEGWKILSRYSDIRLSMTDAVGAAIARAERVSVVFGFDADFRKLGFDLQPALR